MTAFSCSAPVGQACTQAPQDTHSEVEEGLVLAGRDDGAEAAAGDGQREGALHLVAGAHAARADDALGRIEVEIGIGGVQGASRWLRAVIAVAHVAQADRAGHLLHLASPLAEQVRQSSG